MHCHTAKTPIVYDNQHGAMSYNRGKTPLRHTEDGHTPLTLVTGNVGPV